MIFIKCGGILVNNNFGFVKYFSNFVAGTQKPSKADMINRYIAGKITKQQLDEFMEGCKDDK